MSVLLAALAALTWGTSDFIGGLAARDSHARAVVVWSQVIGIGFGLAIAPPLGGGLSVTDVVWGAIAGAFGGIGLVALYTGLSSGRISVVAPVSGVVAAGLPVLFGLAIGERPGPAGFAGMALAVLAIWLVSAGEQPGKSGMGQGLLAGLGFALFFVAIDRTSADAGIWPLIPARLASITVIASLAIATKTPLSLGTRGRWKVAASGVGDMLANMLFLLANQIGFLSIAAVVSSLFPAQTVVLGRFVLKERIRPTQWIGLTLALIAVGLIAL